MMPFITNLLSYLSYVNEEVLIIVSFKQLMLENLSPMAKNLEND